MFQSRIALELKQVLRGEAMIIPTTQYNDLQAQARLAREFQEQEKVKKQADQRAQRVENKRKEEKELQERLRETIRQTQAEAKQQRQQIYELTQTIERLQNEVEQACLRYKKGEEKLQTVNQEYRAAQEALGELRRQLREIRSVPSDASEQAVEPKQEAPREVLRSPVAEQPGQINPLLIRATFERKDLGGMFRTEDDVLYRYPEFKVREYGLAHGAIVWLELHDERNWIEQVRIEAQGDDTDSPIAQALGLIGKEEQDAWVVYPLYQPDVGIRIHEADMIKFTFEAGQSCSFNVDTSPPAHRWRARITQLHKVPSPMMTRSAPNKPVRASKSVTSTTVDDPFLEGFTIAVIGGARKWFESVVTSTGAAFIHDDDKHISRIEAKLQKVDMIFALITSTSHDSSKTAHQIAKAHGIPFDTIDGSKTSLRTKLWESRELLYKQRNTMT